MNPQFLYHNETGFDVLREQKKKIGSEKDGATTSFTPLPKPRMFSRNDTFIYNASFWLNFSVKEKNQVKNTLVFCKIPENKAIRISYPLPFVPSVATDGASASTDGASVATGGATVATDGASASTEGASASTDGASASTDGASASTEGASVATEGASVATEGAQFLTFFNPINQ